MVEFDLQNSVGSKTADWHKKQTINRIPDYRESVQPGSHFMTAAGPIRILCVEDHPVFREGLRTIIGLEPDMILVAHAANAAQAVAGFRAHRPDVTLMDVRLPGSNGVDILIAIRGEFPRLVSSC